jgi:heat shock protein HtpX
MLWQIIASNRRKTVLLVFIMGVILALLGFFIGELVDAWAGFTSSGPLPVQGQAGESFKAGYIGIIVALAFWLGLLLTSLLASDQLFLSLSGAKEVTHDMYPQLYNVVEEMKIASSLPGMPAIYIIDDPAPNAFAVGKSPENSAVCVTAGLLALCTRDELQGVVAHEMGHILNRDILYMTIAATMLGAVTIIADSFLRSLRYAPMARYRSSSSRAGKGLFNLWLMVIAFIFVILSPILSRILYFTISRSREYLADATSARLTRYPEGLASALEKILVSPEKLTTAPKATAPFYIANPYKQDLDGRMFATHPPLGQRIKILRSMCGGAGFKDYVKAYWNVTHTHKALIPEADIKLGETIKIREPSPQTDPGIGSQGAARTAGDIMRAMNKFVFITCTCGMKMKVPPEFARGEIRCPRCNAQHMVKESDQQAVSEILAATAAFSRVQQPVREAHEATCLPAGQQQEKRTPGTWQSFPCNGCGKPIQISPKFELSQVKCPRCGHEIRMV